MTLSELEYKERLKTLSYEELQELYFSYLNTAILVKQVMQEKENKK